VYDSVIKSGLDTLLIAVPFVGVLMFVMFRLDTIFASPRQTASSRRPPMGTDKQGRMLLSDPDGRPWKDG
jgi:hypothetical protein